MVERPFRKPKIRLHLPAQEDRCGSGALCSEAQADGVPCTELGHECETCEKATKGSFKRGLIAQPGGGATPGKAQTTAKQSTGRTPSRTKPR